MTQTVFDPNLTPSLALLDQNFTQNYDLREKISTPSYAAATPWAAFDSSGNFSIGTNLGIGSTGRARFSTPSAGADGCVVEMPNSTTGRSYSSRSVTAPGTTWYHFIGQSGNGTSVTTNSILIQGNGNVTNANNSYGAISDVRLKEDIDDAGSQWADFKAYRVRKYKLKADPVGLMQIGLVAQEVEPISPGLVNEAEDPSTGESTKSVSYSVLYMKAVKCLQEAMERIEDLERRVAAMGA